LGIFRIKISPLGRTWRIVRLLSFLDYIAIDNFNKDGSGLFAIFDGHGGSQVSEFASTVIPNVKLNPIRYLNSNTANKKIT
jgi:serine/threonine protein phosphatase PrpC